MPLTATFAAEFTAFNRSLKEAQVELQVFDRATKTATRSLTREIENFSGQRLAAEAARITEAVERIGGVSKLTESEIRRVAGSVGDAVDKFRLIGEEPPEAMRKLAESSRQAVKQLDDLKAAPKPLTQQIGAMAAGFIAAQLTIDGLARAGRQVVDFLRSSTQEYLNAERAQRQLTAALQAQSLATPGVIQQYNELAGQFQRTTVHSDDLVREMQTLLTTVGGVMPSRMDDALQAATDLAAGLGVDLRTATLLVAKALEGNTDSLSRYGISIDKAAVAARGADAVFEQVQKRFGGQAAAEVDSYAGRLQQLANTWDDVKEAIGRAALTNPLAVALFRDLAQQLDETGSAAASATPSIAGFYRTIGLSDRQFDLAIRLLEGYIDLLNEAHAAGNRLKNLQSPIQAPNATSAFDEVARRGLAEFDRQVKDHEQVTAAAKQAQDKFNASLKQFDASEAIAEGRRMVQVLGALGGPAKVIPSQLKAFAQAFETAAEAARQLGLNDTARDFELLARTMAPVVQFQQRWNVTLGQFVTPARAFKREVEDQIHQWGEYGESILIGPLPNLLDLTKAWERFESVSMDGPRAEISLLGATLQDDLLRVVESIPDTIANVLVFGGDLERATKVFASQIGATIGKHIGAAVGTKLGGELGGKVGAVIGETFGALAGLLVDALHRSGAEDVMRRVGGTWGVAISEGLAESIAKEAKKFGGSRQAAEIFNIDKIIGEAGGLSDQNVRQMTARLRDIFVMVETGRFTVDQATDAMNRSFGEFADFWEEKGGLVSAQMLEIITLSRRMGIESAAVADFVRGQLTNASSGFQTFFETGSKAAIDLAANEKRLMELQGELAKAGTEDRARITQEIEAITAAMVNQQAVIDALAITTDAQASASGGALAAMFAELQAGGLSIPEALAAVQPAAEALASQLEAAGLSGGEAFDTIRRLAGLAKDEVAGPVLGAIGGLGQGLIGLQNSGLLTQDMFAGLASQATQAFDALVAQGHSGDDVLRLMQPTLQTLWKLQEDFGFKVDDTTQAMLDQAEAAGIVGEDQRDANERAARAMERVAERLGLIIDRLYGVEDAGDAAARGIDRVARAASGIPTGGVVVPGGARTPGEPAGPARGLSAGARASALTAGVGAPATIRVPVYLDGYQIAEATVPHIPAVVHRRTR